MKRIVLTAGYDRAWHSLYIAESLRRRGILPSLILLAYPLSAARIKTIIRSRGFKSIYDYIIGAERKKLSYPILEAVRNLHIKKLSLRAWCKQYGIQIKTVVHINSNRSISTLGAIAPDLTIYTGGGILHKRFLHVSGPVLNAHSGPLPMVRGMNALEWSLLLGYPTGVTLHYIDEGIDTGKALCWLPVPENPSDTLDSLRNRLIWIGAQGLVRLVFQWYDQGRWPTQEIFWMTPTTSMNRQCFVVAPALKEIAALRLQTLLASIESHRS